MCHRSLILCIRLSFLNDAIRLFLSSVGCACVCVCVIFVVFAYSLSFRFLSFSFWFLKYPLESKRQREEYDLRFGTYIFISFYFCSTEECVSSFKVILWFVNEKRQKAPGFFCRVVLSCFNCTALHGNLLQGNRIPVKKLSNTECEWTNKQIKWICYYTIWCCCQLRHFFLLLSCTLFSSRIFSFFRFLCRFVCYFCFALVRAYLTILFLSLSFFVGDFALVLHFCDFFFQKRKNFGTYSCSHRHRDRDVSNMFSIFFAQTFPSNFLITYAIRKWIRFRGAFLVVRLFWRWYFGHADTRKKRKIISNRVPTKRIMMNFSFHISVEHSLFLMNIFK